MIDDAVTDHVVVRCSLGCEWSFEGEREEAVESAVWHREQVHGVAAPASGRLPLNGGYGFEIETKEAAVEGLYAPEQMDKGERQRPLGEGEPHVEEPPTGSVDVGSRASRAAQSSTGSSPSPNGRKKHTRESIVAAIREYAGEHGHAPPGNRPPGQAIKSAAARLGLPWAELVAEAGAVPAPIGRAAEKKRLAWGVAAAPARPGGASSKRATASPQPARKQPVTQPEPEPAATDPYEEMLAAAEQLELAGEAYDDAVRAYQAALARCA